MRCRECGREHGKLMDARAIMVELGVSRSAAEALMRQLRKVSVPGVRKVWVWRRDLYALLGGE